MITSIGSMEAWARANEVRGERGDLVLAGEYHADVADELVAPSAFWTCTTRRSRFDQTFANGPGMKAFTAADVALRRVEPAAFGEQP